MNIRRSFRIIFRNKTYSLLNIAGLAIGITSAALIFLWVESKVNFNQSIPNTRNLYVAGAHYAMASGEIRTQLAASNPLAKALKDEFPEIRRSARYAAATLDFAVENATQFFREEGAYADSALFEMTGMAFVQGQPSTAFQPQNAIVISRSMAKKIFGAADPVGKGLVNEGQVYQVTGVFNDLPRHTTFRFDWLIPFRVYEQVMAKQFSIDAWGTSWLELYVEPGPQVDISRLNGKLAALAYQKGGPDYEQTHNFLYPLNRVLLHGQFVNGVEAGGYVKTVRLFFLVGLLILLIACINFMNLSTARSQKRALEVGIRKTFGTKRKYLIRQFLTEAGLITSVALLLSIGLVRLCLPAFNDLTGSDLSFDFRNPYITAGLLAIGLFCTLAAGSYPALYLSSFNPVTTLKMQKTKKGDAAAWIRKGLVVFQFTMAFLLICTTYVIYLQIRLGQNRDIGLVKEHLVTFPVTKELQASSSAVLNELENTGAVANCGFSSSTLLHSNLTLSPWVWKGKDPGDDAPVSANFVSEGLVGAAGIKLIDGTDFTTGGSKGVLINETLAKRMGEEGRIGGELGQSADNKKTIVGIMKNFVFDDPYAMEPASMLFFLNPRRTAYLFVRLKPDVDTYKAIGRIQAILRTFSPYQAFEPMLMTDRFDELFDDESLIKKLSALFAALAIFISCLGLFGLSAFSTEQRTKEIGIRKVLGAGIADILVLLGKSYFRLLLVSFAIGIPVSFYIVRFYLKEYAYKIVLNWDIFAEVALLILVIALLTVSSLSLRAAIANPAKSMKTE